MAVRGVTILVGNWSSGQNGLEECVCGGHSQLLFAPGPFRGLILPCTYLNCPVSQELCLYLTLSHLMIYIQCQCSVPVQEALYPLCHVAKTPGVEVRLVGWVYSKFDLHAGDWSLWPITDWQSVFTLNCNHNISLTLTKYFSCLTLTIIFLAITTIIFP